MARDRGQATPLLAMVVLVAAILALGVARMGARLVDRAAARTAADATALAGAADDRAAAEDLARANGAELVAFTRLGDDVLVTVRRSGETAQARATVAP